MTKTQFRLCIGLGISLGTMALVMLSFTVFINRSMAQMELEKSIKHDLIQDVVDICGPEYPEIHAAIYLNKIVVECRTE